MQPGQDMGMGRLQKMNMQILYEHQKIHDEMKSDERDKAAREMQD